MLEEQFRSIQVRGYCNLGPADHVMAQVSWRCRSSIWDWLLRNLSCQRIMIIAWLVRWNFCVARGRACPAYDGVRD